ncbi:MAG: hypothetical protein AB7I33_16800, partial [Gemmatimonadales bacterium]
HWRLVGRMLHSGFVLLPIVLFALGLGMAIYHWVEHLSWSSAFLNAAMLLGGMGPVDPIRTEAGKWLAGLYALFAGLVVIVVAGAMLQPVFLHVLQRRASGQTPSGSNPTA